MQGGRQTTLAEVHRLQRHVRGLHLGQALLQVALVLRLTSERICLGRLGLQPCEATGDADLACLHVLEHARDILGHAGEHLTACNTTSVECLGLTDLLERTQHRGDIGTAGHRCSQRVTEQLPCHVHGRCHHRTPQEPRRDAQQAHEGREHRRDTRQPLDQQIAADTDLVGVYHRKVVFTIALERHSPIRRLAALGHLGHGSQPNVLQLEHRVLGSEVLHRHVEQHRRVLHAAGQEVEDGLITTDKLLKVWAVLQVADANGRFLTHDKLCHAVTHPVVRDVVVGRQQRLGF